MIYDYIIVGAGLGGISAGLNLAKNNKKVLILEKNSLPGGATTTFKRGRFEFDTTLYDLYDYGDKERVGELQNIFKEYDLDIDCSIVPFNAHVKAKSPEEDFHVVGSIEKFFAYLETTHEGTLSSLKDLLKVTKDIHEGIKMLEDDKTPTKETHPYYNKYLKVNAIEALIDLKIPKEIVHKLGFLWTHLGNSLNNISFIDFAEFMYTVMFKKRAVLNKKNINLILDMINKYRELGGKIHYRAYVTSITKDGDIVTLTTKDNKKYKARNIICDLMPRYVYETLVKDVALKNQKYDKEKDLSSSSVIVYLGLNKDYQYLNLTNYKYYHFDNINSAINIKTMNELYHDTWEVVVPNVVNESASPKNTTIVVLKRDYFTPVFDNVSKNDYYKIKEDIADDLIKKFEEAYNLDIKEYIEEIEVVTPLTVKRYTNNINGAKGYMLKGEDNITNRIKDSYENNSYLNFVGGSSLFGSGAHNAIYSGYYITKRMLAKEDEVDE